MDTLRKDRGLWILFIVIIALAILAGGYIVVLNSTGDPQQAQQQQQQQVAEENVEVLDGEYVCLTGTDNVNTKECTPGIKVGEDSYALDLSALLEAGVTTKFTNGTKILAAGMITPIAEVSDEQWKSYAIKGVMKVLEVAQN